MSKYNQTTNTENGDAKKAKIKEWLMQADWRVKEVHEPQAVWLLTALSQGGKTLTVARPKIAPDRIDIQTSMKLSEDTRRHYEDMASQDRQKLIWDIRIGLIQMGIDFLGIVDSLQEDIILFDCIYDDGLTKDRFLRRLAHVMNGMGYVLYMLRRHFSLPTEASDSIN